MSSQNPPYPYFDGITYNSSFFSTSSSGLTQAVANTLYLKKTVSDTATSSETFSGGIITNGIEQIGTTNITLYGNTTTASIGLGGGQIGGNISIGNKQYRTGNINIGSGGNAGNGSTTTGQLNIYTGSNNTGPINIGTGASSSSVINIGNGSLTTSAINIGASTGTVALGKITGGLVLNSSLPTFGIALQAGVNIAYNNTGFCETNVVNYRNITTGGGITFYDQITTPTAQPAVLMAAFTATGIFNTFPTGSLTTERVYTHNVDTENGTAILFLGSSNAQTVNIGGSNSRVNTITIGNSGTYVSTIQVNAPITLNYTTTPAVGQLGFSRTGTIPLSTTVITDGQTINVASIVLEAGSWLLIAEGRQAVSGTISFAYPYTLRYNITSTSQTYAGGLTYYEYCNLTFQSSISILPYYNFSTYVRPTTSTTYYITCSPLYGNGAATTAGTNMQIGSNTKFTAIRIA